MTDPQSRPQHKEDKGEKDSPEKKREKGRWIRKSASVVDANENNGQMSGRRPS